jgi:hypothetical protein
MNAKSVNQIIDEAKQNKTARDTQQDEANRAEKLLAKEGRGVKISRRDKEFLDAWQQQQGAGVAMDQLNPQIAAMDKQLTAIQNQGKTLTDIKTNLDNYNKSLQGLLRMG